MQKKKNLHQNYSKFVMVLKKDISEFYFAFASDCSLLSVTVNPIRSM